MTLVYYDDQFLQHDTGRHPENARRLVQITRHLQTVGCWETLVHRDVPSASRDQLTLVHTPDYLDRLSQSVANGGGRVEVDTVVSSGSLAAAERAAGAACDAVQRVLADEARHALCLVRPPGHHALADAPMGFCLFNNVAVAARYATRRLGLKRVLIVDWDVHHGNGTQDCFWADEQVAFYSVHRFPFYPGSGAADETGTGAGLGATFNLPIEMGTSRTDYLQQVEHSLTRFADRVRPELILISAGFDSHRLDPVGSLGLETEDFATLTDCVRQIAQVHCRDRLVSVLEGGYNTDILPLCVEQHVRRLDA